MQKNNSSNDRCGNPEGATIFKFPDQANLCWIALVFVVVVTLMAGLLPRGSFKENWLEWDEFPSRTEFGEYGLVHGKFPDLSSIIGHDHQLIFDFVIVPRSFASGNFRTMLHVDFRNDPEPFVIGQWENFLIIMQGYDFANEEGLLRLTANIGKFVGQELKVMVKLHLDRNELYLNGQLVQSHSPSTYDLGKEDARIVIGNSPDGKHGWFGGIAKFDVTLLDLQNKQSELLRSYDFNSPSDGEIIDLSESAASLRIPNPGDFPDKRALRLTDFDSLISDNKVDLVVNFIGFWPLGFFVAIVLWRRTPVPHNYVLPVFGSILVGGLVSFGIEISQILIPGRNSHFHDLVLNVLGAAAGGIWIVLIARRYETSAEFIAPDD